MREIKFRAWDKIDKRMKEWEWFDSDANYLRDLNDSNEFIWMQYTGLKDKNGKEIYEGDILSPGYTDDELFVVVFDETKARFAEKRVSKNYPTHAGFIMDGSFIRSVLSSQRIEIIGNIYENPKLLKRHC